MLLDFRLLFAFNGEVSLKLYLVSCDLLQDADYASLRARLRTFEARPVLANQWALHSTHTAAQLKDILKDYLHDVDRIVVTEVGADRPSRRALSNLTELRPEPPFSIPWCPATGPRHRFLPGSCGRSSWRI